MLFDRRPYYLAGLAVGLAVVALIWFGPKTSPEQRVIKDVAILAREPWDSVRVLDIVFEGPSRNPSDVLVKGVRPSGTPVLVHFAADSPYTARTAVARLQGGQLDRTAEILMVPRSLVQPQFRDRFRRDATHAGIAFFARALPEPAAAASLDEEMAPGSEAANPGSGATTPGSAGASPGSEGAAPATATPGSDAARTGSGAASPASSDS